MRLCLHYKVAFSFATFELKIAKKKSLCHLKKRGSNDPASDWHSVNAVRRLKQTFDLKESRTVKSKKKKGTSQEVSAIILFLILIFDLNQILCDPFSSSFFECVVCCFGRGASSRWLARFPCRDSSNTATTNDRPWSHTIFAPSSSKEKEEGEKQQQGKWSPCVWVGTRRTRATRFPSLNYYFFDRNKKHEKRADWYERYQ